MRKRTSRAPCFSARKPAARGQSRFRARLPGGPREGIPGRSRGPCRGPLSNFLAKLGKESEMKRSRVKNFFRNASHFLDRKCASGHRASHAFRPENLQLGAQWLFVHAPGGSRGGIPGTVSGSAEQLLSKAGEEIRDETVACQQFLPKRNTLS